ncbi:hypothetical protein AVEN_231583-1 [Araneus ventricosus]|uniref:Uncharacterized protein n=1 Tax=Araneus ventricosus TaxID=182803 RepID=A0A4Y2IJ82_ARAVE|nr:hypothetical protein AVEN_231583-1 [Araneus ventricosus]
MSAILKNKWISGDEKVKLYMQVLQKKLNILDHNNKVVQETISEAALTQHTEEKEDLMEHLILESASKNLKSNTQNILNNLKDYQDLMHWSSNGELIYRGKMSRSPTF